MSLFAIVSRARIPLRQHAISFQPMHPLGRSLHVTNGPKTRMLQVAIKASVVSFSNSVFQVLRRSSLWLNFGKSLCSSTNSIKCANNSLKHGDSTNSTISDEINSELVVLQILDEAEKIDITELKRNVDKLKPIVELFLEFGAGVKPLKKFILRHPMIAAKKPEQLESALKFLSGYGVSLKDSYNILPFSNNLFLAKKKPCMDILDLLRGYGIPDRGVIKVMCKVPAILDMSKRNLTKVIDGIGENFLMKDVITLITNEPEILLSEASEVKDKLDYIIETMNMKYTQLMRSNALQQSLFVIRARHQFLLRSGYFEPPDKNKETKNIKNPTVREIFDTTNEDFVAKLAPGFRVEDYLAFCKVFEIEEDLAVDDEDRDDQKDSTGYRRY